MPVEVAHSANREMFVHRIAGPDPCVLFVVEWLLVWLAFFRHTLHTLNNSTHIEHPVPAGRHEPGVGVDMVVPLLQGQLILAV